MTKPGYFPVLDTLRLFASMAVFLAHSIVYFRTPGPELHFSNWIKNAGYYGVIFFYTLSGFLITFLLMKEKDRTGTIAVKNFYIRRALRIWPLYYLIVFCSFLVFPFLSQSHPFNGFGVGAFILYLLFLPNIAILKGYDVPTCFHTYTIGYEEQFYLLWPLVLKMAGRNLRYWLAGLFVLPLALDIIHLQIVRNGLPFPGRITYLVRSGLTYISYSNMPAFIAGGMAALLYLRGGEKLLAFAGKKIVIYGLAAVILVLMNFCDVRGTGYVNIVSALFAMLIVGLVQSGTTGGAIGAIFARGGRISYGIYIYHPAILILISFCMSRGSIGFSGSPLLTYILYLVLSFGLLLITAALSYRYFERYFIRKKMRFRSVGSGPSAEGTRIRTSES